MARGRRKIPATTPLGGDYSFQKADLGTIKGIGGILDSTGEFERPARADCRQGRDARRRTSTVDVSKQPVPLDTTFEAVVDGTDGDTYLNRVDAKFLQTALTAKGAVVGTKGVKGRTVKLNVDIHEGRIEDLLRLAVKGEEPLLVGQRRACIPTSTCRRASATSSSGSSSTEQFDVDAAKFTDAGVQQKLVGYEPARARAGSGREGRQRRRLT